MSDRRNIQNDPARTYTIGWAPRKKQPTVSRLPAPGYTTQAMPPSLRSIRKQRSLIMSGEDRRYRYQERRKRQQRQQWCNGLVPSIGEALAAAALCGTDKEEEEEDDDDDCESIDGLDLLVLACAESDVQENLGALFALASQGADVEKNAERISVV